MDTWLSMLAFADKHRKLCYLYIDYRDGKLTDAGMKEAISSFLQSDAYELGTALFVIIRNYAYSGMFRYNAKGEFNVPYGGIGYNHKNLDKKYTVSFMNRNDKEAEHLIIMNY